MVEHVACCGNCCKNPDNCHYLSNKEKINAVTKYYVPCSSYVRKELSPKFKIGDIVRIGGAKGEFKVNAVSKKSSGNFYYDVVDIDAPTCRGFINQDESILTHRLTQADSKPAPKFKIGENILESSGNVWSIIEVYTSSENKFHYDLNLEKEVKSIEHKFEKCVPEYCLTSYQIVPQHSCLQGLETSADTNSQEEKLQTVINRLEQLEQMVLKHNSIIDKA